MLMRLSPASLVAPLSGLAIPHKYSHLGADFYEQRLGAHLYKYPSRSCKLR